MQRTGAITPKPAGVTNARRVQTQASQRQAATDQVKDKIQQVRNAVGSREDLERRRRIQVSLRNRNSKPQ